jgi:hypothetical protein
MFDEEKPFRTIHPACLDDGNTINICPPADSSIPCGPVEDIEI